MSVSRNSGSVSRAQFHSDVEVDTIKVQYVVDDQDLGSGGHFFGRDSAFSFQPANLSRGEQAELIGLEWQSFLLTETGEGGEIDTTSTQRVFSEWSFKADSDIKEGGTDSGVADENNATNNFDIRYRGQTDDDADLLLFEALAEHMPYESESAGAGGGGWSVVSEGDRYYQRDLGISGPVVDSSDSIHHHINEWNIDLGTGIGGHGDFEYHGALQWYWRVL